MKPVATYSRKRKEALPEPDQKHIQKNWAEVLEEAGVAPPTAATAVTNDEGDPEPLKSFPSPPNVFDRLREASKKASNTAEQPKKKAQQSKFVFKSKNTASSSNATSSTNASQPKQMYLDLGQSNFTTQTCSVCGMVYSPGQPQDEALHQKFHKDFNQSLSFQGWKNEDVVKSFSDGSRIVRIVHKDIVPAHKKKLDDIKQLLNKELGFTEDPVKDSRYVTFAYIQNKKIKGVVIVEPLQQAHPIIPNVSPSGSPDVEPNATTAKTQKTSSSRTADELIRCSKEIRPAAIGINRVYVLPEARRKNIATRLLDTIRANMIFGTVIEKELVAFSQPTEDGHRLASRYLGQTYLVYH